jgi:hypothetical protein
MIREFSMIPIHSIEEGVKKAEEILKNSNASITAIPDGIAVMVAGD